MTITKTCCGVTGDAVGRTIFALGVAGSGGLLGATEAGGVDGDVATGDEHATTRPMTSAGMRTLMR
jgi:hypothetical protein